MLLHKWNEKFLMNGKPIKILSKSNNQNILIIPKLFRNFVWKQPWKTLSEGGEGNKPAVGATPNAERISCEENHAINQLAVSGSVGWEGQHLEPPVFLGLGILTAAFCSTGRHLQRAPRRASSSHHCWCAAEAPLFWAALCSSSS